MASGQTNPLRNDMRGTNHTNSREPQILITLFTVYLIVFANLAYLALTFSPSP